MRIRRDPRRVRLRRPGDPRPRARAPRARARRARLRLARRAARVARSTAVARNGRARPRSSRTRRRSRAGADVVFLCLGHERGGRARAARRTASSSTSPARTGCRTPALYAALVRLRASAARTSSASWSYALPELAPPTGRLIANPGCYATAALLALAPLADAIDPAGVVVDAKSGVSGAGRALQAELARRLRARERLAVPVGRHQHAPEIAQALGFPVCFVPHLLPDPPRAARHLLRAGAPADDLREPARGRVRGRAGGHASCPRASRPSSRACRARTRPRSRVFEDRATGRTIVVCALDNLGKGAAGQAVQNANLALGLDETAGLRLPGCSCERHRRQGLRRERRPLPASAAARPTSRSSARPSPRSAPRCSAGTASRPRLPARQPGAPRARRAAGGRRQLRRRERRHRRARASSTRWRPRPRRRGCSTSRPRRCSSSRPA